MNNIVTQVQNVKEDGALVGRLFPGESLLKGIERVCLDNQVQYGVIVALIGSLRHADIVYAISDPSNKVGIKYSDSTRIEGPLELLVCQGMIGLTPENKMSIHLHGVFSDSKMKLYGGHFIETGNIVLATVEFMIKKVKDAEMIKEFDEETGFPLFRFLPQK